MAGELRRGSAAIQEAVESTGGDGTFRRFIPAIYWKEDAEERYLLFLNEMDAVTTFDMVNFIKTEQGFMQETVAKTDPFHGEKSDEFVTQWDATPRKTTLAVAVELEPRIELVNGRKKPRGFEVKTVTYDRTIFDDDGNATDEKEEVTAPAVGVIAQSPHNFFNVVSNFDATESPIHTVPVKITRVGKGTSTTYAIVGYEGQEVDLSNLIEYVDGISYLGEQMDELIAGLPDDPEKAALAIGDAILEDRIEELLDDDRYQELLAGVTESMDIYGKKKGKDKTKAERKTRPSAQRKSAKAAAKEEDPETETDSDPEPVAEEPKKKQSAEERMAELKKRAAAKAKK